MASDAAKFPINGGTYAPYGVITDDNHGSFVIIATWIFGCISVLFVVVRVILRTWTSRHFGRDNGLIVAALCFALAQSISASESVRYGLGRHWDTLSDQQLWSYYRTILASDILSVFVFVLSKLSLIALISHITPSNIMRIIFRWYTVFVILWGISGVFSVGFQCGASVPTRGFGSMCVNEGSLLFTHGIINILTDLLLVILPVFIVWKVQIRAEQRFIVLGLFWARTA
ncbi:hypothetical protein F5Y04DRAFT_7416 [Hypomontagnella monticulosa]|nr:hypothetical protein F5Y04DRAFT_7416 [Hypomontagnella monticulosa]